MTTTVQTGMPLFSWSAPSWADEPTEWWNGTAEHHRFARRPLMASGWLQQYDEMDVADGVLTLVRKPATHRGGVRRRRRRRLQRRPVPLGPVA